MFEPLSCGDLFPLSPATSQRSLASFSDDKTKVPVWTKRDSAGGVWTSRVAGNAQRNQVQLVPAFTVMRSEPAPTNLRFDVNSRAAKHHGDSPCFPSQQSRPRSHGHATVNWVDCDTSEMEYQEFSNGFHRKVYFPGDAPSDGGIRGLPQAGGPISVTEPAWRRRTGDGDVPGKGEIPRRGHILRQEIHASGPTP